MIGRRRPRARARPSLAFGLALLASLAARAEAATFRLADGGALDGEIAQIGTEHVSIRTRDGYELVRRDAIVQIVMETDRGGVAGRLVDWLRGVYTLETTRGVVEIDAEGRLLRGPTPAPGTDAAGAAGLPVEQVLREAASRDTPAAPTPTDGGTAEPATERASDPAAVSAETGADRDVWSGALAAAAASGLAEAEGPTEPARPEAEARALGAAYLAALGLAPAARPAAGACAALATLVDAPAAPLGRREDPRALRVALGGEIALAAAAEVVAAYFAAVDAPSRREETATGLVLWRAARRIERPAKIELVAAATRASALAMAFAGEADLALVADAPLSGAPAADAASNDDLDRLIGFDAIAVVAHPQNPIGALPTATLGALLSGRIDDWSMLEPLRIGRPRLYLPRDGSDALTAVLNFADVRRARPAAPQFVDRGDARLAAVSGDPDGLAVLPWSALKAAGREAEARALGQGAAAVAPTLDSIRSAAYPLIVPLHAHLAPMPEHPAARSLAAFLSGPLGQRALFESGFAPVAACDPSSCALAAAGLDAARLRLRETPPPRPLRATVLGAPPTLRRERLRIDLESPTAAPSPAALADLEALLAGPTALPALTVVARLSAGAAQAPGAWAAAEARAEATALALACAGRAAARAVVAPDPAETALGLELRIVEE